MRKHPVGLADLSAYHDGALDEDRRRALDEHLESCADCRARLSEYASLGETLRGISSPAVPASVDRRVAALTHPARGSASRWTLPPMVIPRPVVAAVAIAAALTVALLAGLPLGPGNSGPMVASAYLYADQGSSAIEVQFTKPVNHDSVARSVQIDPPVNVKVTWRDDTTMVIKPAEPLHPTRSYTLQLKPAGPDSPATSVALQFAGNVPASPVPLATKVVDTPTPTPMLPTATATAASKPKAPEPSTIAPGPSPTASASPTSPTAQTPGATTTPAPGTAATLTAAAATTSPYDTAGTPTSTSTSTPMPSPGGGSATPTPTATAKAAASPTAGAPATGTATPEPVPSPTLTATSAATPGGVSSPTRTVTPKATATPGTPASPTAAPTPAAATTPWGTAGAWATVTPTPTSATLPAETATPTPVATVGDTPIPEPTDATVLTATPFEAIPRPGRGMSTVSRENPRVAARLGTARSEEMYIQVVQQDFQRGTMFWRADTREILVLMRDGRWSIYPDTWPEGEPLANTAPAPAGMTAPAHGFGQLWREHLDIQRDLGWAITAESQLLAASQRYAAGQTLWTATGMVYILYQDGSWQSFVDRSATPTPTSTATPAATATIASNEP